MTNDNSHRMFVTDNSYCHNCLVGMESILHMLRNCPLTYMVQEALFKQQDMLAFFNIELISHKKVRRPWSITFGVAIWYL
ncbi:hypothetical protein NC652_022060 [Populus alba x Populus x berolinensis]|nr:hypothetical protein NC652_022060 [Populus alba x Populus x berolinensis]